MALTSEQVGTIIDNLELAMATGALSVTIDGRVVTYRSMADLQSALTYFKTKQAKLDGTAAPKPLLRRIDLGFGYQGTQSGTDCP